MPGYTYIFIFGVAFLLAAGVLWWWNNIGSTKNSAPNGEYTEPTRYTSYDGKPISSEPVGFRTRSASFTERMVDLVPDSIITVRDPLNARKVQLQVVTVETFHGRRQYRGSPEWQRSGDDWSGVLCVTSAGFSETEILLLQTSKHGYMFRRRDPLGPEGFKDFAPFADAYGNPDRERLPNSTAPIIVNVPYGGANYVIVDIGVWDITAPAAGQHIPEGVLARWLLAVAADSSAILVEDSKKGGKDSVWVGQQLDLNSTVVDTLSAEG